MSTTIDRILEKIELIPESGCWVFMGTLNVWGYGQIKLSNSRQQGRTHRITFEHFKGKIPEGLVLDHLCRVRCCCNPNHLEPVTHKENSRRGEPANRTHCPKGHEYSEANTYLYKGFRFCRECHAESERIRRRK